MQNYTQNTLQDKIQSLTNIPRSNVDLISRQLQITYEEFVKIIAQKLNTKLLLPLKKITLKTIGEQYGVNFGVKNNQEELIFGAWLFDLPKLEKEALLFFILIKEAFQFFIEVIEHHSDVRDIFIDIITILWLKEYLSIKTRDNHIISSILSRVFSTEIAGKGYLYWDSLLDLLFRNNIASDIVYQKANEFILKSKVESLDKESLIKLFFDWVVITTVKGEDVIAPIFISQKLLSVVDALIQLGYEKGTSSNIAKLMKVHQNTIRNIFSELRSNYSTHWRPIFNLEKINLYNYLFKIKVQKIDSSSNLMKTLQKIPYLKTLYTGFDEQNSPLLYSPSLICPHVISELLREELEKMQKKNEILDYTLQLVRSKSLLGALTLIPFDPTIKNFQRMIEKSESSLKQYTFSVEKKDFSMEFDVSKKNIDKNLLFFLAILRVKYLIKARYGVWVNEFYQLCKDNNVSLSDVPAQMDFINQLEIRARRRGLLNYSLDISKTFSMGDVLIIEIPSENKKAEELTNILNKLNVFASINELKLYDRTLLILAGIDHNHPITRLLHNILVKNTFNPNFFTVKRYEGKFVPYHDLYDYENETWFLGLTK